MAPRGRPSLPVCILCQTKPVWKPQVGEGSGSYDSLTCFFKIWKNKRIKEFGDKYASYVKQEMYDLASELLDDFNTWKKTSDEETKRRELASFKPGVALAISEAAQTLNNTLQSVSLKDAQTAVSKAGYQLAEANFNAEKTKDSLDIKAHPNFSFNEAYGAGPSTYGSQDLDKDPPQMQQR